MFKDCAISTRCIVPFLSITIALFEPIVSYYYRWKAVWMWYLSEKVYTEAQHDATQKEACRCPSANLRRWRWFKRDLWNRLVKTFTALFLTVFIVVCTFYGLKLVECKKYNGERGKNCRNFLYTSYVVMTFPLILRHWIIFSLDV